MTKINYITDYSQTIKKLSGWQLRMYLKWPILHVC